MQKGSPFGDTWQGSIRDFANVVHHVKRLRLSGRLSLRNSERLSVAHLYFRAGKLVHIVGNRGDAHAILLELRAWTRAFVRFDLNSPVETVTLDDTYELLLSEVLAHLKATGVVTPPTMSRGQQPQQGQQAQQPQPVRQSQKTPSYAPPPRSPQSSPRAQQQTYTQQRILIPRVIDSDVIINAEAKQLITPQEWQILIEGTRRVSLAVAHLVGPKEALHVLRDILDDCTAAFPAFACLRIAPTGYLEITDSSQLDHLSREELLAGFTALIATCQYFCSPIVGDNEAHRLMIQALREIGQGLTLLGVFQVALA